MISSLIAGGTGSLGLAVAKQRAKFGEQVVLTSRDAWRAERAARDIGGNVRGITVVLFGGLARNRPYPGSTMVTTFNAGVSGLARTLALELAPIRINAVHPGVVGDSARWRHMPDHPAIARTPLGRLVTMAEIVDATDFLLTNTGVSAIDLVIDGGMRAT